MKVTRRCKNCDNSMRIGALDDPERRRCCHCVTSGSIKNESECKESGYKHFSEKEREEADHGV
jgi:hypothetical protein